ncbi:MAG: hypothetical protein OXG27_05295 [Chloroflexi bacterium]|nr:hypothetical protein [Chloroflexota bacterium]
MVVREKAIQFYQWDRFPRARTAFSIALVLPVIVMGFLMSWSFEGPLRYGPYLLCLVAVSAVFARPCNRPMVVAIAAPMAMSLIGMMFVAITLPMYAVLATIAAIWRRTFGTPYDRVVWPDFPPGRLRQVAAATTIACGIACVWIAVLELR